MSSATVSLKPVTSSNIKAIGHDPQTNELHVQYHSGDTYIYSGVSAAKHEAALTADSIGKFINTNVKGAHQFRKA